jgi:hypothetical protein
MVLDVLGHMAHLGLPSLGEKLYLKVVFFLSAIGVYWTSEHDFRGRIVGGFQGAYRIKLEMSGWGFRSAWFVLVSVFAAWHVDDFSAGSRWLDDLNGGVRWGRIGWSTNRKEGEASLAYTFERISDFLKFVDMDSGFGEKKPDGGWFARLDWSKETGGLDEVWEGDISSSL